MDTADTFNTATNKRAAALDTLIRSAERIADADDYGEMLDAVRIVELDAEEARRAIITEARAAGYTWEQIGVVLGVSKQAAWERYA